MRYNIYCDESSVKGKFYSNFYGGALINENRRQDIEAALQRVKNDQNVFNGELKWTKISEKYEPKYVVFIKEFFEFVRSGDIKVRIMFTQNINSRPRIMSQTGGNEYFMLYYQFVKHAFGLRYSPHSIQNPASIALFMDDVPQTDAEFDIFKDYMSSLTQFPFFRHKGIVLQKGDIAGIDSKKHNILQAVDIVLGAMDFRLNDKHLEKPLNQIRRGKRTRCKERVYKCINREIRAIYPNFNIGKSTGIQAGMEDRWEHAYRHWCFVPSDSEVDLTKGKKRK